jgi:hypothetical protein
MPRWAARPLVEGTETCIGASMGRGSFQSAAAERWLSNPRHLRIGRVDFLTHVGT